MNIVFLEGIISGMEKIKEKDENIKEKEHKILDLGNTVTQQNRDIENIHFIIRKGKWDIPQLPGG